MSAKDRACSNSRIERVRHVHGCARHGITTYERITQNEKEPQSQDPRQLPRQVQDEEAPSG
jgi:hypothetical protein